MNSDFGNHEAKVCEISERIIWKLSDVKKSTEKVGWG
jgi:hypothetical protein